MKFVCVYPSLKHLLMKIFCEIKEDMHLTGLGQGAIVNIKVSESWLTNLPLWSSELDLDQRSGCSNLASPTGPTLLRSSPTRPASPAWRRGPWLQSTFKALTSYKTRGQRGMGTTSWPRYRGGDGLVPILWHIFFQAWYCHAGVHESKVVKSTSTLFANLQISIQWQQTKSIFSSAYLHIETEKLVGQWYYRRFYTLRPRTVQGFNLGRQSATFVPLHESFSSLLSARALSKWKC